MPGDWLGTLFLLFVCLLVADLVTGFGYWLPQLVPSIRLAALAAGLVLSFIAVVQGTRPPVVRDYEVRVPGLSAAYNGAVVVVASGLHLGTLLAAQWLSDRVDQINAQRPDLMVLAGDIVEGRGAGAKQFLPGLRRLSAPLGVWAVNGNHEGYGRSDQRVGLLHEAGFHVLRDQ